ncbi:unannotated protein [freshwater metagenome]|uniref:Unannotated protein n=1 Tax=freshwater metagenome TaxID=449393 RepID=A0A6J6T1T2_9ZZZZ|nr:sugar kinase [Actinomycetota bacterium]
MAKNFDLFTFGETLALFMTTDTDSVVTATSYSMTAAGTEANVAVAAHQLGLNVYFQTKLGPDQLGEAVSSKFAEVGLATEHFIRCDNYTGALVRNHGGTQPFVNTYLRRCSAGSTFSIADIDEQVLANSKWLHVTGISVAISESSKDAVIHAIDIARKNKVGISFDLNYRKKLWDEDVASRTLKTIIKDLDVVSGGVDEYEIIFGSKDPEENLATVASLGVKTVIMTSGPDEMRILHDGKRFNFSPQKVKLVDPVGSGDAFISGTISGLIGGVSIEDAIAQGSKCGAAVAATRGDWALMISGKSGVLTSGAVNG